MQIILEGIKMPTIIGVYDWEKNLIQTLIIDAKLEFDASISEKSDNLQDTIDYDKVITTIIEFGENNEHNLLEALANNLAALLLNNFKLNQVSLTITKPGANPAAKIQYQVTKQNN